MLVTVTLMAGSARTAGLPVFECAYTGRMQLLAGALHPLPTRAHLVVVFVHGAALRSLAFLHRVDLLETEVLGHRVRRRNVLRSARRENAFKCLDLLLRHGCRIAVLSGWARDGLRELDVELHIEVAEIVVAVAGHSLSADDLNLTWGRVSKRFPEKRETQNDIPGEMISPGRISTVSHRSSRCST